MGCLHPHREKGSGEGPVPSFQNFFLYFKVKMAYFRGLCAKFRFFSMPVTQYKNTAVIQRLPWRLDLHAIKSVIQGRQSF